MARIVEIEAPSVSSTDIETQLDDSHGWETSWDDLSEETQQELVEEINEGFRLVADYVDQWFVIDEDWAAYGIVDTSVWDGPLEEIMEDNGIHPIDAEELATNIRAAAVRATHIRYTDRLTRAERGIEARISKP